MTNLDPPVSATLVLEDGTILEGSAFGATADAVFELVFNTSLTGYQEILTDPSYRGQGVVFTAVHIGNTGINSQDPESSIPQISALAVRALSQLVSSWRSETTLDSWLASNNIPAISDVDTRFLTRRLRDQGTMKAALSTRGTPASQLLESARQWSGLDGIDMVSAVTCAEAYAWTGDSGSDWVLSPWAPTSAEGDQDGQPVINHLQSLRPRVVLYDFGAKRNIARHLASWGADVMVVPAATSPEAALAYQPDGVLLSNGPGDPAGLPHIVEVVSGLIESGVPLFGICLGHQLLGRALGAKTRRLKFGHHGGNHPVQDLRTRKVLVTAQNHNYMVDPDTLDPAEVELTHISLNDGSLEGLRLKHKPVFSVQFHPEAAPGPHDGHPLFAEFWRADGIISSSKR